MVVDGLLWLGSVVSSKTVGRLAFPLSAAVALTGCIGLVASGYPVCRACCVLGAYHSVWGSAPLRAVLLLSSRKYLNLNSP